jgi:hypothetical protein
MKYKIGDRVRVKEDLLCWKSYGGVSFVSNMKKYRGKVFNIVAIVANAYRLESCNGELKDVREYVFSEDMLEPAYIISKIFETFENKGTTVTLCKDADGNVISRGIARLNEDCDDFSLAVGSILSMCRCLKDMNETVYLDQAIELVTNVAELYNPKKVKYQCGDVVKVVATGKEYVPNAILIDVYFPNIKNIYDIGKRVIKDAHYIVMYSTFNKATNEYMYAICDGENAYVIGENGIKLAYED